MLRQQIQEDMKNAMRAKEALKLTTIRMLLAAIKQTEIDSQIAVDTDAAVITIVNKMIKQRRDAKEQYANADRPELAEKEQAEIDVLLAYLPQQLSETEIETAIKAAIEKTSANSMKDMGKVMGELKGPLAGKADMAKVSAKIKQLLT